MHLPPLPLHLPPSTPTASPLPGTLSAIVFPGERVYDITFWKSELNSEINSMATEIENLKVTHPD